MNDNDETFPCPRYQAYATPADQDNPTWLDIAAYHNSIHGGDDVWFNALPKIRRQHAVVSMGHRFKKIAV